MDIKIWARKKEDSGGIRMMPLRSNIPEPKNKGWILTHCPSCGRECWEMPLPEGFTEDMFEGKVCTLCGIELACM